MENRESLTIPKWIVFQLTENCNLRCHMCYQWGDTGIYVGKPKSHIKSLNPDTIFKIIEETRPFNPYIGLFGGEPLLYKNIWDIISMVKKSKGEIYLDTNGTTLSAHAEKLIEHQPDRLWISLDGPEEINDRQRGKGVFKKVMAGIEKVAELKRKHGLKKPELGIAYIVTEMSKNTISEFFLDKLNIDYIDNVSIELQNYILMHEWKEYDALLKNKFGKTHGGSFAKGLVRKKDEFGNIDYENMHQQIKKVREFCLKNNINFICSPQDFSTSNIENYFSANWDKLTGKKSFCPLPWKYAEIASNGDVVLCHTFYDNAIGNVHEEDFLAIWHGEKAEKIRKHLKKNLYSICTGCARYHTVLDAKA